MHQGQVACLSPTRPHGSRSSMRALSAHPSSWEPFIHASSKRHFTPPGLWLVLRVQRWTVSGPCLRGAVGGGARAHPGPQVTEGFRCCDIHMPPHPCHPLSKAGPHTIPSCCYNFLQSTAHHGRTFHWFCWLCALPSTNQLHRNQDLVPVASSPIPAPPQGLTHSRCFSK